MHAHPRRRAGLCRNAVLPGYRSQARPPALRCPHRTHQRKRLDPGHRLNSYRTGSAGADPVAVELAETALTGPLQVTTTHRRSSGPSLTGGYVVRPAQPVLRPPPTPFRQVVHFPRSSVIGRHAPTTTFPQHASAGEGLPSSRRHRLNVPRPLRRGVPRGCSSRIFTASMAFAVSCPARLSLNV